MTIRERIEAALRWEPVDMIPLVSYPGMPPLGFEERRLRNRGLGFRTWSAVLTEEHPNVHRERLTYSENGVLYERTTHRTPMGEVYSTSRFGGGYGSSMLIDYPIKRPNDYRIVEFMIKDTVYRPAYDLFQKAVETVGEDGYVCSYFYYSPLMEMRVNLLGLERFSEDLHERPDLFFSLYETLNKKHREAYPILAKSPAHVIEHCANASPDVIGRERFERYILPCYDELGEQLHANGKLLSSHLDANNGLWRDLIAQSSLDIIGSFTPAPDTDMSIADARLAWPGKILWINFPSSLHLASSERIKAETRKILQEAAPGHGLIIGTEENIPDHAWRTSLNSILDALEEDARSRS